MQRGEHHWDPLQEKTAAGALKRLLNFLIEGKMAVLSSLDEINAIGHRIVHGGKYFNESVVVTSRSERKSASSLNWRLCTIYPSLRELRSWNSCLKKLPKSPLSIQLFIIPCPKLRRFIRGPTNGMKREFNGMAFMGSVSNIALSGAPRF